MPLSDRERAIRRIPIIALIDRVARVLERRNILLPGGADRLVKASQAFPGSQDHFRALAAIESYLKDDIIGRRLLDPRHEVSGDPPLLEGLRNFGLTADVAERLYEKHAIDQGHLADRSPLQAAYRVLASENLTDALGAKGSTLEIAARVGLAVLANADGEIVARTPMQL